MKALFLFAGVFGLGFGTASLTHLSAQPAQAAPMNMSMMSGPDGQMQAAMDRMNGQMKSMRMSGEVDRDFMLMMIPHHQSAIDMAKIELQYGRKPVLKALARDIISSQSKEISQMRNWLHQWYGV